MEKQIELIKNLIALSKSTHSEEESQNCVDMVQSLMKKHGITEADLQQEKTEIRRFLYETEFEQTLLMQICSKVKDSQDFDVYVNKKKSDKPFLGFELTDFQFIEISTLFDFYKPIMKKEMKKAASAFCLAQKLTASPVYVTEMSKEQIELANLASGFKKHNYIKSLNE